ncbi:MAG: poly-gamma-glutamate synthase PgsB [Calditrichaeota bacterium]|nr:MAG: poly-gamma-glutamate synthase PgsB [Calditrichota bacterium]
MLLIFVTLILMLAFLILEYKKHLLNVKSIPIRIHVNGTRGKSSVTRLIAAGLRSGGVKTVAKTTGTLPRFILPDGSEENVYRFGAVNINEQIRIFRKAASLKPEAIVIECMAVRPELQWTCEHKIVKATIGVLTNARLDHVDEMGPTMNDIAFSLANTVPVKSLFITSEHKYFDLYKAIAEKNSTNILPPSDPETISDEEIQKFDFVEHKENVALALDVCAQVGVKREEALEGMYTMEPDFGVLRIFPIHEMNKEIRFLNGFAANDNESTAKIYDMLNLRENNEEPVFTVVNLRADRVTRTEELAFMIARKVTSNYIVVIGTGTDLFMEEMEVYSFPQNKILKMGNSSGKEVLDKIISLTPQKSVAIGIGNIAGIGIELLEEVEERTTLKSVV